jgi:hypothetical protein
MSVEVARFLDNTEYSTNAIIIPQKSYWHSALRDRCFDACAVYSYLPVVECKDSKKIANESSFAK